eukprot:CAMPEP_0184679946 /NCGR_PEP_ID=MMETSP0312-20130426/2818_1 /TAXON_ID=31354 /ORGANISM="Compsopogon coeruleus, Strain SAG 36.94" /LENGTH=1061 /DNA_ID=CAMNT_0027129735 /DNA_START=149 /DNA_END=3334 /DNA_ORIENTATION=-
MVQATDQSGAENPSAAAVNASHDSAAEALRRVVAEKVDAEVGDSLAVRLGQQTPAVRRTVVGGVVASCAALGMTLANTMAGDSPPAAVSGAGAVAGAGLGAAVSFQLAKRGKKAARRRLAQIVRDAAGSWTSAAKDIAQLQTEFSLSNEEFRVTLADIYTTFLSEMVKDRQGEVAFRDFKDLIVLKRALNLRGDEIGDAHTAVAKAFYAENRILLELNEQSTEIQMVQKQLDKFLFLSGRVFDDNETEEARVYEMSRISRIFSLPQEEIESHISKISLPFYRDVVARAVVDGSITKTDLLAAEDALGVFELSAKAVKEEAYNRRLSGLVTEKKKFDAIDLQSLARLRDLLGISEKDSDIMQARLAHPAYREAVRTTLEDVRRDPGNVVHSYGKLMVKRSDLQVDSSSASEAMATEIRAAGIAVIQEARKFLRVQNLDAAVGEIRNAISFADAAVALLECDSSTGEAVNLIRKYMGDISVEIGRTEPRQLYRLYLAECLKELSVSEEEDERLRRLRALLGLSEAEAAETFKGAAGPLYQKKLREFVESNRFDAEAKQAMEDLKNNLSLPGETARLMNLELYRDRLASYVGGNKILTEEESTVMLRLREFLGFDMEDVNDVHRITCSPLYQQSIDEAMGSTGIIIEEYREALGRLRDRLGLTEKDATQSLHNIAQKRMKQYVDRALAMLEKRQLLRGQNEAKDVGDDVFIRRAGAQLGIEAGGVTVELSNLVDFYNRNELTVKTKVETEEVDPESGEKKSKVVTSYPVTLRSEFDSKVLIEVYKQYLIQCFTAKSREEKSRFFDILDQLGGILGLEASEINKVHSDIGSVIYKQFVNQALLQGGLEEKDMAFLKNIEEILAMSPETCTQLLKDAKENRISVLIEQTFSRPKVAEEMVRKVRITARELGVDLVKDLSVSNDSRKKLFTVEVDAAIEANEISASKQSLLTEIKQDLQIDDDIARDVLLEIIQRRSVGHLVQAAAALRQDRGEVAVSDLQRMMRFGRLLPSELDAPLVSESEKQELFMMYQAHLLQDGQLNEQKKEDLALVKLMLGFEGQQSGAAV